jgi:hypothetical protein
MRNASAAKHQERMACRQEVTWERVLKKVLNARRVTIARQRGLEANRTCAPEADNDQACPGNYSGKGRMHWASLSAKIAL